MPAKLLGSGTLSATTILPPGRGMKDSSRRKHRCWRFHVSNLAGGWSGQREIDVLPPFRKKYTSVKRLVLNASSDAESGSAHVPASALHPPSMGSTICVEVEFAGPQPSQGPGALLCELLAGATVEAKPVHLERGRKKKTKACTGAEEGGRAASKSPPKPKQATPSRPADPPTMPREDGSDGISRALACNDSIATSSTAAAAIKNADRQGSHDVSGPGGHDVSGAPCQSGSSNTSNTSSNTSNTSSNTSNTSSISESGESCRGEDLARRASEASAAPSHVVTSEEEEEEEGDDHSTADAAAGANDAVAGQENHQEAREALAPVTDLSVEPSSPVRKRHRTFSIERLRSTIDKMSIVDSDSEDDEGEDVGAAALGSELCPLMSHSNWEGEALDATLSPLEETPLFRAFSMDSSPSEGVVDEDMSCAAGRDTFGSLLNAQELLLFIDGHEPLEVSASGRVAGAYGNVAIDDVLDIAQPLPSPLSLPSPSPSPAKVHRGAGIVSAAAMFETADPSTPKAEEVYVTLGRKECDFMGRAQPGANKGHPGPPEGGCSDELHTIFFSGLGLGKGAQLSTDLDALSAKVHFWIHPMHCVAKEAIGPIQVSADGNAQATVRYPSMKELSLILDEAVNIRVVEVDLTVMVRSREGNVKHASPNMKVTYRRPAWPSSAPGRFPRATCRRISKPAASENGRCKTPSEAAKPRQQVQILDR